MLGFEHIDFYSYDLLVNGVKFIDLDYKNNKENVGFKPRISLGHTSSRFHQMTTVKIPKQEFSLLNEDDQRKMKLAQSQRKSVNPFSSEAKEF